MRIWYAFAPLLPAYLLLPSTPAWADAPPVEVQSDLKIDFGDSKLTIGPKFAFQYLAPIPIPPSSPSPPGTNEESAEIELRCKCRVVAPTDTGAPAASGEVGGDGGSLQDCSCLPAPQRPVPEMPDTDPIPPVLITEISFALLATIAQTDKDKKLIVINDDIPTVGLRLEARVRSGDLARSYFYGQLAGEVSSNDFSWTVPGSGEKRSDRHENWGLDVGLAGFLSVSTDAKATPDSASETLEDRWRIAPQLSGTYGRSWKAGRTRTVVYEVEPGLEENGLEVIGVGDARVVEPPSVVPSSTFRVSVPVQPASTRFAFGPSFALKCLGEKDGFDPCDSQGILRGELWGYFFAIKETASSGRIGVAPYYESSVWGEDASSGGLIIQFQVDTANLLY